MACNVLTSLQNLPVLYTGETYFLSWLARLPGQKLVGQWMFDVVGFGVVIMSIAGSWRFGRIVGDGGYS